MRWAVSATSWATISCGDVGRLRRRCRCPATATAGGWKCRPFGAGSRKCDVGRPRRRHAVGAPECAGEHLGRRPALVGGHRRDRLAPLQPPRRPLEHDAPPQRGRRLSRQPCAPRARSETPRRNCCAPSRRRRCCRRRRPRRAVRAAGRGAMAVAHVVRVWSRRPRHGHDNSCCGGGLTFVRVLGARRVTAH